MNENEKCPTSMWKDRANADTCECGSATWVGITCFACRKPWSKIVLWKWTQRKLNRYAEIWEMEPENSWAMNHVDGAEWSIIRSNTVDTLRIDLDMTYQFYAEGSWCEEVFLKLDYLTHYGKSPTTKDQIWFNHETIIVKRLYERLDSAMTKYLERDIAPPPKEGRL